MLINMVLPGAAEEPFAFTYSGSCTDNRIDGVGTVRLNTSGTLTVLSGKATVSVYILAGGGGGRYVSGWPNYHAGGGGGGYQTVEVELAPGTYEITIGAGGEGVYTYGGELASASDGGDTSAFGHTSTGGKGGGRGNSGVPGAGGTPNGGTGTAGTNASGGSPNGGGITSSTGVSGGDGYVELTFI